MAKAVFTTRRESNYDDLPEDRYHFPKSYLKRVECTVGDWIVYYEPSRTTPNRNSRGGRQAYYAIAKVERIERDNKLKDHFYAYVSSYLEFDEIVPFRAANGNYCESALVKDDGTINKGAFGHAVRIIPGFEFNLLLEAGFKNILVPTTQIYKGIDETLDDGLADQERPLIRQVVNRRFRDSMFSKNVRRAYEDTCAVTGLNITNGGGRPEVQAAHIQPVSNSGPDSIRNGIALSGTVHWMFDRGLISIDDDYTILTMKNSIPDPFLAMLDSKLRLPISPTPPPHQRFLQYHRDNIFKG